MFAQASPSSLGLFKQELTKIFFPVKPPISSGLTNFSYPELQKGVIISESKKVDQLATDALRLFSRIGLFSAPTVSERTPLLPGLTSANKLEVIEKLLALLVDPDTQQVLVCPVYCADGVTRNLHTIAADPRRGLCDDRYHTNSFIFNEAAKELLSAIWNNIDGLMTHLGADSVRQQQITRLRFEQATLLESSYNLENIQNYLNQLNIKYLSQITYNGSTYYSVQSVSMAVSSSCCMVAGAGLLLGQSIIPGAALTVMGSICYICSAIDYSYYGSKRTSCLEVRCYGTIDIAWLSNQIENRLLVKDVIVGQPTTNFAGN